MGPLMPLLAHALALNFSACPADHLSLESPNCVVAKVGRYYPMDSGIFNIAFLYKTTKAAAHAKSQITWLGQGGGVLLEEAEQPACEHTDCPVLPDVYKVYAAGASLPPLDLGEAHQLMWKLRGAANPMPAFECCFVVPIA